jgi:hypothetical protein
MSSRRQPSACGHLSEPDARALMTLLDMSRWLASKLSAAHHESFATVEDASSVCAARPDVSSALLELAYSHWHCTPKTNGPGVYEKLLTWAEQERAASLSSSHGAGGGQPSHGIANALHLLVRDCAAWPASRVSGVFYLADESSSGAALLVQSSDVIPQPVYEVMRIRLSTPLLSSHPIASHPISPSQVLGIGSSLGDLLRRNGQQLPGCFELTLLPFMGRIVHDGTIRGRCAPQPHPHRGHIHTHTRPHFYPR